MMMTGLNPERVMQCLEQLAHEDQNMSSFFTVSDYNVPNVSDKVVRIIMSYTDYIKRVVWGERES